MALGDIFKGFLQGTPAVGQGTPPQPVSNQGAPPAQGSPQLVTPQPSNPNPTVPNANTPQSDGSVAAIPPAGQGAASPLENFRDLWKADPNAKAPTNITPSLKFDPAKLLEAAKGVDFAGSIPAEIREKIKTGDESAIMHAMNQVGQLAYAQSIGAMTQVTEAALKHQGETLVNEHLPRMIREYTIRQATAQDNPILADPAAAPIVSMIEQGVVAKYPNASPTEVKEHVNLFMNSLAQMVVGQSGATITPARPASQLNKDTDWEKYFTA